MEREKRRSQAILSRKLSTRIIGGEDIYPLRPATGEIYEHYKKKTHRVFSMDLDASRQEDIVIYKALYPTGYDYFSRPLTEWNEQVASLDGTGLVPRFLASISR